MNEKVILLGEDNNIEVLAFKKLTNKYNIKLIHFENGLDIYNYLKDNLHDLPNLVILDINMPSINGIDLVKMIRDLNILVPIIMFSTSNNIKDVSCSYVNGSNSYIVKPIDFECFEKIFKSIINYWLDLNLVCFYNNEDCKYAKDIIY